MFKCSYELHKCISLGNVCDNKLDCLLHDDEMFCELSLLKCPISCSCLLYAITCFFLSNNIEELDLSSSLLSVSVFKSKIVFFHMFEQKLKNIQIIKLNVNNIISICPLLFLKHILLLNVAENHITAIKQNCFSVSTILNSLNLSSNHVVHMSHFAYTCKTEGENGISRLISALCVNCLSSIPDSIIWMCIWSRPLQKLKNSEHLNSKVSLNCKRYLSYKF